MYILAVYIPRVGRGDARMGTTQQAGLASTWVSPLQHTTEKRPSFFMVAVSSVRSSACNSEGRAVPGAWQAPN